MTPFKRPTSLLGFGVVLAPAFYAVVVAQMMTRPGFDIRIHPLSLLSLGAFGWIQVANFLIVGAFAIACAFGMYAACQRGNYLKGVYWLIGTFGIGMIVAGLAPPDPLSGFPPGSPVGVPERISVSASIHGIGFGIAFFSLVAASLLAAARQFGAREINWSIYSGATALVTIALLILGFSAQQWTSMAFFAVGIVAFGWVSAIATHVLGLSKKQTAFHSK